MMSIRLKFIKGYETKYISHLDLMRTFQRAIRRAGIPISYSKGFNPHPKMSFASALGIGLTSKGEYLDLVVEDEISGEEIMKRLNEYLPKGLRVIDAVTLEDKAKSAMSLVTHARYYMKLNFKHGIDIEKSLSDFLNSDVITVFKEQPKKNFQTVEVDIKPMIKEIKVLSKEGKSQIILDCLLASGSKANLKPQLLIDAIKNHIGSTFEVESIERIELYADRKGQFIPLLSIDNR